MISDNELYKALDTIQKACNEMDNSNGCRNCRMSNNNGDCLITHQFPCSWKLKEPEPVTRLME